MGVKLYLLTFAICAVLVAAGAPTREAHGGEAYSPTDVDGDGCGNWAEHGSNSEAGGQRDSLNVWDFFDTPDNENIRDGTISIADVGRVVGHFGTTGDPSVDPLSFPWGVAYHTAFDRGGALSANLWEQAPADGSVTVVDIGAIVAQFGHSCTGAWGVFTAPPASADLFPWGVAVVTSELSSPGEQIVLRYNASNILNGNVLQLRIDELSKTDYPLGAFPYAVQFGTRNALCTVTAAVCPAPSSVSSDADNLIGRTRDGVQYRLDNTNTACDEWNEIVFENSAGAFGLTEDCSTFATGGPSSLRVLVLPIIQDLCYGSCTVTVTNFRLFFLEGFGPSGCTGNDCEVVGRFITP